MSDVNFILTEEFVEYSAKISKIFADKKAKQEEMKQAFDSFKAQIKAMDDEAKGIHEEFEAWKATAGTKKA